MSINPNHHQSSNHHIRGAEQAFRTSESSNDRVSLLFNALDNMARTSSPTDISTSLQERAHDLSHSLKELSTNEFRDGLFQMSEKDRLRLYDSLNKWEITAKTAHVQGNSSLKELILEKKQEIYSILRSNLEEWHSAFVETISGSYSDTIFIPHLKAVLESFKKELSHLKIESVDQKTQDIIQKMEDRINTLHSEVNWVSDMTIFSDSQQIEKEWFTSVKGLADQGEPQARKALAQYRYHKAISYLADAASASRFDPLKFLKNRFSPLCSVLSDIKSYIPGISQTLQIRAANLANLFMKDLFSNELISPDRLPQISEEDRLDLYNFLNSLETAAKTGRVQINVQEKFSLKELVAEKKQEVHNILENRLEEWYSSFEVAIANPNTAKLFIPHLIDALKSFTKEISHLKVKITQKTQEMIKKMIFKIENKGYGDLDMEKSSDTTIFSDPKKSRNFDLKQDKFFWL